MAPVCVTCTSGRDWRRVPSGKAEKKQGKAEKKQGHGTTKKVKAEKKQRQGKD